MIRWVGTKAVALERFSRESVVDATGLSGPIVEARLMQLVRDGILVAIREVACRQCERTAATQNFRHTAGLMAFEGTESPWCGAYFRPTADDAEVSFRRAA